jgi:hypothetical protein
MSFETLEFSPAGVIVDLAPATLDTNQVSRAVNVDFQAGTMRALSEVESETVPLGAPLFLQYYDNTDERRLAYAYATGIAEWNGVVHASIKPVAGLTNSLQWDADVFGQFFVVTNDATGEAPHAKQPQQTLLTPIPGWPAGWDAKFIRTHRNVLFAMDMVEAGVSYPARVRWSVSAVAGQLPSAWLPLVANDAGFQDLELPGGKIVAACALADTFWIAGVGGIWLAQWQGGAFVYQFRQRTSAYGARGQRCMVSVGDAVAVLTRSDLILLNEQSERSLLIARNAKILGNMGPAQLLYIEPQRQLYVLYGLSSETTYTRAMIWDKDTDTWGYREFDQGFTAFGKSLSLTVPPAKTWTGVAGTWTTEPGAWSDPSTDVNVYQAGNAALIGRSANRRYSWTIERLAMPAPKAENVRLRSIEVDIDGPAGQTVFLRLGAATFPGEAPAWGPERAYVVGAGASVRHDDMRKGRYVSYTVRGSGQARLSAARLFYRVDKVKP